MKNQIILWLSSFVIVFLIGYVKNVTDKNYPVTGTFGIEGRKVSYKLDRESFTKSYYSNIIISDIDGIEAKLLLKNDNSQNELGYSLTNLGLECQILKLKPGQSIQYKIIIKHKDQIFEIPKNDFVTLTFWGNIPFPVKLLYSILLYSGLLMAIRSLLEIFNNNQNLKKILVIGCSIFIILIIIINPLYSTYKLGAMNHFVPSFSQLFDPLLLSILIIWIAGTTFIFNRVFVKTITVAIAVSTVLLFFFI